MGTERGDGRRIARELRVSEHVRERTDVRDSTVDVKRVKNTDAVAFVKMELACRERTGSFGDEFVAELNEHTRRCVARGGRNEQIGVGPGTQFRTSVVRSGQHSALEQDGLNIDAGQRGQHVAKLALSRRFDDGRRP